MRSLLAVLALSCPALAADSPFAKHGRIRVAKSGTHLEHADGTPFFFLADTCWTGPALSAEKDWQTYLTDRVKKGFTAVQFNMVSPWRTAPTDAEGNISYVLTGGKLTLNEKFYTRLDARLKAINDAGLLAVPVLCWALKKTDAGNILTEEQITTLCKLQVARYKDAHVLWILAGDNPYRGADADKWKRIGRAVFGDKPDAPVTTHPTGENFPWKDWEDEKWLTVLGYQSGHGDSDKTLKWLHSGPVTEYGKRKEFTRPVINLEPPYEAHNGYASKKPHTDYTVRRTIYWSLLNAPVAGFTYGGHGVWSWHTKPGQGPTDHEGSGIAKVWSEALGLPGAGQLKHVRTLMDEVKWTTLRPYPEGPTQPADTDPAKKVLCAKTVDNSTYVFYYPAGATASVRLHARGGEGHGVRWFNPRDGKWEESSKRGLWVPPDDNDWVLVVKP
jgi:Protein of unknown function (DUF4038)/Putative collagen-binding domain of a collagenase